MASHLLPLTLSVTVVIDVRHAYIITLPALFINPSDYLTVTTKRRNPAPEGEDCGVCYSGILHVSGARDGVTFSAQALSCCASSGAVCSTQSK